MIVAVPSLWWYELERYLAEPLAELPPAPKPPSISHWPGEWVDALPEDVGLSAERVARLIEAVSAMPGAQSLLVAIDGRLVVEQYFRGARSNATHNMKSASKSVLSTLVGIAIDRGFLELSQPISDFFPQLLAEYDRERREITVRHLLTMSSGLESTSFGGYGEWVSSENWVEAALMQPMTAPAGSRFRYSTGNTHLLSAVLTAATGMSTRDFANRFLFEPMEIDIGGWERDPQGIYMGGNNLAMTPRDMLKFGQLYLDRGRWGDEQLVPFRWVDVSTGRRVGTRRWRGYGYLWWVRTGAVDSYYAKGFGGQIILVIPASDAVVVVTSSLESKGRSWDQELFTHIERAIIAGAEPLRGHGPMAGSR